MVFIRLLTRIAIAVAYFMVKSATYTYEVYSILKMNVGTSKSERILDAVDVGKQVVNVEDKVIEINSTNFIREAIKQLDFGISYFRKENLKKIEIYKLESPINIILDSAQNQLTGIPFYVNILNKDEFELEYSIENDKTYRTYNYRDHYSIDKLFLKQEFKRRYRFDAPIKEPTLDFSFTVKLVGDPKKFEDDRLSFKLNALDMLADEYLERLKIEIASRNSNILYLRLGSQIIQKEVSFLNALMDVVIQNNLNEKNQEALKTIDFIDYQLADASTSLNKAESDLESIGYAQTSIGETSVLYQQRSQLETQISQYNAELQNLRNFINNLQTIEGSPSQIGSLNVQDQLIDNLLIKLTDLIQQKATLKRTATEANPVIQRVNLEIETTKVALRNALNGTVGNYNVLIENLRGRLNQVNATINKLPSAERRKLGIQRKFTFSDNTYDLFMQRKAAAGISLATNQSDWTIVENAKVSKDLIWPKVQFIYILAFFLGILFPVLIVLVIDLLDTRIKNKEDIKKVTTIPVLGAIVKGNKNGKLLTQYNSKSALTESFRDIRVNLQFLSPESKTKFIGVTSSGSKDGKSFFAMNLAIVAAHSGKRVIIVDADLRNSYLVNYFDLKNFKNGLSTYLIGNNNLSECIAPSGIKNLDIVPAGPKPPNPSEILSLPKTNISSMNCVIIMILLLLTLRL